MSPRRRVAVVAALVAVVLAVAGTVLALLPRGEDSVTAAAAPPGPVLLVPGYGGGTEPLVALAARLRASGREAVVVTPAGDGTGDLREQAATLARAADAASAAGAPSVDVVGYSAGGVVARLWVAELGGDAVARRVVTLGSPHHGTDVAALAAVLPSSCPPACRQLVPGSPLLDDLPETPAGPAWTSMWTDSDQVATPPTTARLDGAVNVELQQVCPGQQVGHGDLPTDPLVRALLARALGPQGLAAAPDPDECASLRAAAG